VYDILGLCRRGLYSVYQVWAFVSKPFYSLRRRLAEVIEAKLLIEFFICAFFFGSGLLFCVWGFG